MFTVTISDVRIPIRPGHVTDDTALPARRTIHLTIPEPDHDTP